VCKLTAFGKADLNLFKRRWQYILAQATLRRAPLLLDHFKPVYVSVKLDVYSLYSMAIFVAVSYQGLSFFPHKIFTAINKIHAPKENQCKTLWHLNGFLSHEMINLFLFFF